MPSQRVRPWHRGQAREMPKWNGRTMREATPEEREEWWAAFLAYHKAWNLVGPSVTQFEPLTWQYWLPTVTVQ